MPCASQIEDGDIIAFFPLHNTVNAQALSLAWIKWWQWPHNQPVTALKDYFGEKVGTTLSAARK